VGAKTQLKNINQSINLYTGF